MRKEKFMYLHRNIFTSLFGEKNGKEKLEYR
jgi:hypothetical protein